MQQVKFKWIDLEEKSAVENHSQVTQRLNSITFNEAVVLFVYYGCYMIIWAS